MFGDLRGKYASFFIIIALLCVPLLKAEVAGGFATDFGKVERVDENRIKGATVEYVTLFPRESDSSDKHIERDAVLVKRNNAVATILICHGFMCNKADASLFRSMFPNCNCMTFDFRAHGEKASGQCCTFGRDEAHDVIAAARFLRSHPDLKSKPLLSYSFSMGAAASIEGQARDGGLFDGMILDCPFDSSENVLKRLIGNLKFSFFGYKFNIPGRSFLEKYVFHPYVQSFVKYALKTVAQLDSTQINTRICPLDPAKSIQNISVPCFFIHCKNDDRISVDAVKRVYQGATGYKRLWLTGGRRHFDSFFYNPEKYVENVQRFAMDVIEGRWTKHKKQEEIIEDVEES